MRINIADSQILRDHCTIASCDLLGQSLETRSRGQQVDFSLFSESYYYLRGVLGVLQINLHHFQQVKVPYQAIWIR